MILFVVSFFLLFLTACDGSGSNDPTDTAVTGDSDSATGDEVATDDDSLTGDDPVTDSDAPQLTIAGFVQKGPFVQGSEITIQELDASLVPIGTSYTTDTIDDFGSFGIARQMSSNFIEVTASGFYFNEVKGELSAAGIQFRVVADISEAKPVNINILTTIERERIKELLGAGDTFEEARAKAEQEILAIFNITSFETANFQEMDISKEGDSNAILLAISAVLQQGNSEAELSELISKITQDIKTDGTLDNEAQRAKIVEGGTALDLAAVRTNIEDRYTDLGLTDLTIPLFEDFVDSDGDGLINRFDFTAAFAPVTNADLTAIHTSNSITVVLPPAIAEATATLDAGVLVINGAESGATAAVTDGDTIAIRLAAPTTHGATATANLTVSYDPYEVAGAFLVTAKSDKYFALEFTAVTDGELGQEYTSNEQTITLPATIADAVATLDNGAIIVNGVDKGVSTTVVNGDTVAVRLASSVYETATVGTLEIDYLGNVVSGAFSVSVPRLICDADTCEDLLTGLVWMKDYTGSFDQDYWKGARDHCLKLELGGKSDWRLPKVWEFRTIVRGCPGAAETGGSCGVTENCLDADCADTGNCSCFAVEGQDIVPGNTLFNEPAYLWEGGTPMNGGFWTGSVVGDDPTKAWAATPANGPDFKARSKTDAYTRARCVRSDTDVDEEFSEIYTDPVTGLQWTKQATANNPSPETYCNDLVLEGKNDWRLPTITELRSIVSGCASLEPGGSCGSYHDCATAGTCTQTDYAFCHCTEPIVGECFMNTELASSGEMPSSTVSPESQRFTIELCGSGGRIRFGPLMGDFAIRCVRN